MCKEWIGTPAPKSIELYDDGRIVALLKHGSVYLVYRYVWSLRSSLLEAQIVLKHQSTNLFYYASEHQTGSEFA